MFANGEQNATQIDDTGPVELERFHRGSSRGRNANNEREILVPAKMVNPFVPTGMEQKYGFAIGWVGGLGLVVLMIVATLTGERQIVRNRRSSPAARHDMFR